MSKFFEYFNEFLFKDEFSLADVLVVMTISAIGGWWLLALIPWFIFSAHMSLKY